MAKTNTPITLDAAPTTNLWQLGVTELTGHNIESSGREEVNTMLKEGWLLLHIYTLKYREDGTWRERPMAILGKPATESSMSLSA